MDKTNAERQKEYRERKKLNDPKFLDKGRKRQKKYYVSVKKLSREEHQKRKEEARKHVTNFHVREASKSITLNKSKEDEPLLKIKMTFPKPWHFVKEKKATTTRVSI